MTKFMTPSMTLGQIDKAVRNYRAMLEKHASEFGAEAVQTVLGQSELAGEQLAVFRRRVEAVSNLIIRKVKVNRARSPQEAIAATGLKQYVDDSVVSAMPRGEGEEVEAVFFQVKAWECTRPGFISDDDLEKAFARRGIKNDPIAVAKANEDDPTLADEKPHGTHWKDASGNWCCAAFGRGLGGRGVGVGRGDRGWIDYCWFAGSRKIGS